MKFCNISWIKNKPALFTIFLLCIFHLAATSQVNTSSPYSRYGIGDLQFGGFSKNRGMGGLSYGLALPYSINYSNPASYHAIALTTFEAAVNGSYFELKNNSKSGNLYNAEFGYLALGFPLKTKKWGMSLGLLPYSSVGYNIKDFKINKAGELESYIYEGSGGLNQFYVGTGWSPTKNFSAGVNASFVFGTLTQIRRVEFSPTSGFYNTKVSDETIINDFHFSLGLLKTFDSLKVAKSDSLRLFDRKKKLLNDSLGVLEKVLKSLDELSGQDSLAAATRRESIAADMMVLKADIAKADSARRQVVVRKQDSDWSLSVGLTGSPSMKLKGKHTSLAQSYILISNDEYIQDTVYNIEDRNGKLTLPYTIGLGFTFRQASRWIIGADISTQNWQDYSLFGERDSLANSWRAAGGFQWTPNDRSIKSYFNLVQYRFGAHYEQTYLQIHGDQLQDYGFSLGFGFPMKRVATTIQVALEAGRRGTTDNNLIELNYVKCSIGFTLNDRWFVPQKFD